MGFLRRMRPGRLVNAIVAKLDGPPEPPAHVWPPGQAWALLRSSEQLRGSPDTASGANSMFDDVVERAMGSPYRFELEVHRPGRAVEYVTRKERVPGKIEGILFLESRKIPAGAEVPIVEIGPGREDFRLDWDAFAAIPHQADRLHHLRIAAQRAVLAKNVPPGAHETAVKGINDLARSVAAGLVAQDVFDKQVRDLSSIGWINADDAAYARAIIVERQAGQKGNAHEGNATGPAPDVG